MQTNIPIIIEESAGIDRFCEPVTLGIPLPQGLVEDSGQFGLSDQNGGYIPLQTQTLAFWPDKSLKWLLFDFQVTVNANTIEELTLDFRKPIDNQPGQFQMVTEERLGQIKVDTGVALFFINTNIFTPFDRVVVGENEILSGHGCNTVLTDDSGVQYKPFINAVQFETKGPLRTTLKMEGAFKSEEGDSLASFIARLHFYANRTLIKTEFTLLNPRAAQHPGGLWDLGDSGSILFKDLSLNMAVRQTGDCSGIKCRLHSGEQNLSSVDITESSFNLTIYQDSSGGENWQSRNHVNRNNEVRNTFRGFRIYEDDKIRCEGLRANPTLSIESGTVALTGAIQNFWQNFPKALESQDNTICLRLFPKQYNDEYELQGGEQKTHVLFLDFNVSDNTELGHGWLHAPLLPRTTPEWYVATKAIPYLSTERDDPDSLLQGLINTAIKGDNTFFDRREIIDEYGWRNFGEFYADHEAVGYEGPAPMVSHYNNQYDGIYGSLLQFLRSGNNRWFLLADQLCKHVEDIDIYHSDKDRPEYNHGLFWHTEHYLDAQTASHRCFSERHSSDRNLASYGGGPSLSHNYTSGLLLHHYLTGSELSKDAVLQLGSYALNNIVMSKTISNKLLKVGRKLKLKLENVIQGQKLVQIAKVYGLDGPGRSSGNLLNSLLDVFVLTRDNRYLHAVEDLIASCISPVDDIEKRDLLDVENRWMYTVFLQSLGKYLDLKSEMGSYCEVWQYARQSLIHYAEWMAQNEKLYLTMKEKLEFPNETWAAQDLRKCIIFLYAIKYSKSVSHQRFWERARFFFDNACDQMHEFDTKDRTRPLVIILQNYGMYPYFIKKGNSNCGNNLFGSSMNGEEHLFNEETIEKVRIKKGSLFSLSSEIQFIKWRLRKS